MASGLVNYLDDFRFAVRRSSIILDSACTLPEKTRDDSERRYRVVNGGFGRETTHLYTTLCSLPVKLQRASAVV